MNTKTKNIVTKVLILTVIVGAFVFALDTFQVGANTLTVKNKQTRITSYNVEPAIADTSVTITIGGRMYAHGPDNLPGCPHIPDPEDPNAPFGQDRYFTEVATSIKPNNRAEIVSGPFSGMKMQLSVTPGTTGTTCDPGPQSNIGSFGTFNGSKVFDVSGLADGTYTARVQVTDDIGSGPDDFKDITFEVKHEGAPNPITTGLVCGVDESEQDIFITWKGLYNNGEILIANGTKRNGIFGPKDVTIPKGTYKITTTSYDSHSIHGGQGQKKEEWVIEFRDIDGNVLATTDKTSDIPGKQDYVTEVIEEEIILPKGVVKVAAVHAHLGVTEGPESVTPICIGLEKGIPTPPPPGPGPDPDPELECPFVAGTDGTIIHFEDGFNGGIGTASKTLIGNGTLQEARLRKAMSIPAGEYKVRLAAYDNHTEHGGQGQLLEQYHVRFKSAADALLAKTNTTSDIPENEDWVAETVNNKLTIPTGVAYVEAFHDAWVTARAESVTPVCMKFTPVDTPPNPHTQSLTLIKNVINDDGRNAEPDDFNLRINTNPITSPIEAKSGVAVELTVGNYVVSENNLPGYTAGVWGGDCAPLGNTSGTVTLGVGEHKVCTITNDDNPPPQSVNLYINKSVTPSQKSLNDTDPFTYTLNYGNEGGIVALNSTITDTPSPTNILHEYVITDNPEHGTCTALTNGIECDLGTVGPGQVGTIKYTAKVIGDTAGVVENIATISTTVTETTLADNTDEATVEVGLSDVVDVKIEKLVNGQKSASGSINTIFTYVLSYENIGPFDATDVDILDELESVGIVEITAITKQADHTKPLDPTPCSITNNKTAIACGLGTLESGDSGTIEYTAKGIGSGTVKNFVHISADNEDSNALANNDDDARVTVGVNAPQADVAITKIVSPAQQNVGGVFTYTLSYDNLGNIDAENVKIDDTPQIDTIIGGFSIISGPQHGSCTEKANDKGIECDLGTLKPGDSGTVEYTANALKDGDVKNIAVITTTTGESDIGNNQDDARVIVGSGGCVSNCGGGGGGGGGRPRVFLFGDPQVAGASVLLSSVPYTGVGDVVQMIVFFVGLIGIAGFITYGIFRYRALRREINNKTQIERAQESMTVMPATPVIPITEAVREPEPMRPAPIATSIKFDQLLNARAQEMSVLMSADARNMISDAAEGNEAEVIAILERVVSSADKRFDREDGWLLLNKSRVEDVLFTTRLSNVPLFVQWLVNGDEQQIFSFLRSLSQQGNNTGDFIRDVVTALDGVYQARLDGTNLGDVSVADLVNDFSREELESLITTLTRGIDGGYSSALDGVKVAVMRIVSGKKPASESNIQNETRVEHPNGYTV